MLRQETLDISQTNLANFGTELEYKIKQASAEGELAFKRWVVDGSVSTGTFLWRVNNFRLEEVSGDHTPDFFRGDCYLALSVTGSKTHPTCNIFYWIGDSTSIDEAGTVAYKAFELDNVLTARNFHATQYREVCGVESDLFLSNFPGMRILAGGYDSGFHHVEAQEHKNRLLRVYRDTTVEVPLQWGSLRTNGVFILDAGKKIYQWSGRKAEVRLRGPAMAAVRELDDVRGILSQVIVLTEGEICSDSDSFARELGVDVVVTGTTITTIPEEVRGTRGFALADMQDPLTGRSIVNDFVIISYVTWDGKTFNEGKRKPTEGFYIEVTPQYCTVYAPGATPIAALCAMAYFTWAKRRPVTTKFVL
jgi:Gelsolin repeat